MCYLNATHWEVSGYTSLSLFHGGSKPSLSCSLTLAEKRLLTPSVCSREPTLGADGRHRLQRTGIMQRVSAELFSILLYQKCS